MYHLPSGEISLLNCKCSRNLKRPLTSHQGDGVRICRKGPLDPGLMPFFPSTTSDDSWLAVLSVGPLPSVLWAGRFSLPVRSSRFTHLPFSTPFKRVSQLSIFIGYSLYSVLLSHARNMRRNTGILVSRTELIPTIWLPFLVCISHSLYSDYSRCHNNTGVW